VSPGHILRHPRPDQLAFIPHINNFVKTLAVDHDTCCYFVTERRADSFNMQRRTSELVLILTLSALSFSNGSPTQLCRGTEELLLFPPQQSCTSQFISCHDDTGDVMSCPDGLAFNLNTSYCDWPDLVTDCDPQEFYNFTLPYDVTFPCILRHQTSCYKFYVCVETDTGLQPRQLTCPRDLTFDPSTNTCRPVPCS